MPREYTQYAAKHTLVSSSHHSIDDDVLAGTLKHRSVLHFLVEHLRSKAGIVGLVPLRPGKKTKQNVLRITTVAVDTRHHNRN